MVFFNANRNPVTVSLPKGKGIVCVNAERAGIEPLAVAEEQVVIEPISACVLTLDPPVPNTRAHSNKLPLLIGGIAAAAVAIGGTVVYLNRKKKQ